VRKRNRNEKKGKNKNRRLRIRSNDPTKINKEPMDEFIPL
jgi:hypothetical protein